MQRYAALWTGDNVATDDHMLLGIRMLNSIGLSGIPFAGMDIGGFAGDVAPKTYARWITLGAFMPLCRIHTMINNRDTEPWALGESIEVISRNYISLRYKLMTYFYSCFYQHTQDGMPIQRSLAIDFPNESEVFWNPLDNQFFCGPSLMIAPCSSDKEYLKVYFPGKDSEEFFYNLWTDEPYLAGSTEVVESPLHLLPVFARPGAIIPIHKTTMHTGESPGELLELHLYYRSNGETTFTLYDDGGDGYDYLEGAYAKRVIKLTSTSLSISAQEGTHDIPFKTLKLVFHGFDTLKEVTMGTETYKLQEQKLCWLEPLPNIDPLGDEMHLPMYQGLVCTFALTTEAIEMSWTEE
jgi:alpha-glucosidase